MYIPFTYFHLLCINGFDFNNSFICRMIIKKKDLSTSRMIQR